MSRHTAHVHTCDKCGREIRGNGIGLHRKKCDGVNWAAATDGPSTVYRRKRKAKTETLSFSDRLESLRRHEAEFWASVGKADCWEWTGRLMPNGYGRFGFYDEVIGCDLAWTAHRAAWELSLGEIPHGLQLDHLCRNRVCVNPAHLEVVTNRENGLRGDSPAARNARKTQCPAGHPLSGDNLMVDQKGHRRCRTCIKETRRRIDQKRYLRKKAGIR